MLLLGVLRSLSPSIVLVVLAIGCSSKDERPPATGSGGTSGATGSSGGTSGTSGGTSGTANLPDSRPGGCAMELTAHDSSGRVLAASKATTLCTAPSHTRLGWTQDVLAATGLVATRTSLDVTLGRDLAADRIPITELKVTLEETELPGGAAGGPKQFTKTSTWTMPAGSCTFVGDLREYFGTKAVPNEYRYQSTLTCIDAAAPTSPDAQPNTLTIDKLTTSTSLPE